MRKIDENAQELQDALLQYGPIVHFDQKDKEGHVYYSDEEQAIIAVNVWFMHIG